eukprot:6205020-Pleurochrysis_carterae.AAC.2
MEANCAVGGERYIASILKYGATTSKVEGGDAWKYKTTATLELPATAASAEEGAECVVCDVVAGGDIAAAHAAWALDSPIADYGCWSTDG